MRVLITGGAGFVGRWFTSTLLAQGHEVVCIDNLIPGGGGIAPSSQWWVGDPMDYQSFSFRNMDCRDFFLTDHEEWDLVVHLAAVVGGRLTIELDPLAVAEDLAIDAAFWRWTKDRRPGHVIHFSSSAAYPIDLQRQDRHRALKERDVDFTRPIGVPDLTYGWAKLTSEFLAQLAVSTAGIKVATYRPFSGYGEDQDLSYPFPSIMKRAVEAAELESETTFVWGAGTQERDFIHIEDVVAAVLHTYPQMTDGHALNLGTGRATNFVELANLANNCLGRSVAIETMADKPTGVFSRVADIDLLSATGFELSVPLEIGVERGVTYWQKKIR